MGQAASAAQQQFPSLVPNGSMPDGGGGRSVTPTPSSAAAAAVAAVAQGLRQQMCGLAAPGGEAGGQQGPSSAAVAALASALLGREADNMHQAATALNNNTVNAMLNNGAAGGLRHSMAGLGNMSSYKQPALYSQQRPQVEQLFHEETDAEAAKHHMDGVEECVDGLKPLDASATVVE